jgi:methylenetetrahydrofolate reductase (NADPH)
VLLAHLKKDSNITYYVIDKRGDLRTNTRSEGPNAVTWGVFPGKEIVQPTIVEAVSFMAWKVKTRRYLIVVWDAVADGINLHQDEAFELGQQWANFYDADSPSKALISDMMDSYSLVNVVHNDFQSSDAIFKPFYAAAAQLGHVNGDVVVNGVNGSV